MSTEPLHIGVTGPASGGAAAWHFTRLAVRRAGGVPVRLTPQHPDSPVPLDGLVLGGGADVGPQLYGEERLIGAELNPRQHRTYRGWVLDLLVYPAVILARLLFRRSVSLTGTANWLDESRDALELKLLREALEKDIPVLAICRGEQLLNVFCGGTLHQDLAGFYVEDREVRSIFPRKRIDILPDTLLAQIVRRTTIKVNALHRQGVNRLGTGLKISARDRNGIVQAIELEGHPFVLGVQWHPEFLPQVQAQRRLFRALVKEAARRRAAAPAALKKSAGGTRA